MSFDVVSLHFMVKPLLLMEEVLEQLELVLVDYCFVFIVSLVGL